MKKKPVKDKLTDTLRRAALESGRTAYALARDTGTPYAAMWVFLKGKGGLQLTTAGRLARVLGLRLVSAKRKKG